MRAQNALGDAAMGRNMVTRPENREPSGLQIGDALEDPGSEGRLAAVLLQLGAETIENESSPVVAHGDALLVARYILEQRHCFTIFEDLIDFGANALPILDERLVEGEILIVMDWHVADQRLASKKISEIADEVSAEFFDPLTPLLLQLFAL